MDIIEKAKLFATAAHAAVDQRRKYTNEPYIVHPAEVANIVSKTNGVTDEMIAAAWLHDVVEDTAVNLLTIEHHFGTEVGILVYWLTNKSKPEDGNRVRRKEIDRLHMAAASSEAQTIKVADLISNTSTITKYDPEFAKVYLEEKRKLLEVLVYADRDLLRKAWSLV
jgi:(p)ppGpp synthase/HD superfamily hydrolase